MSSSTRQIKILSRSYPLVRYRLAIEHPGVRAFMPIVDTDAVAGIALVWDRDRNQTAFARPAAHH